MGLAIGSGTDIAIESADIVLMHSDILDVVKAVKLSQATMRTIKQNLFWAFAYNVIGIPIAMGLLHAFGGPLLNPMFAGAAMALSSVSVVLNALRLKTYKLYQKYQSKTGIFYINAYNVYIKCKGDVYDNLYWKTGDLGRSAIKSGDVALILSSWPMT